MRKAWYRRTLRIDPSARIVAGGDELRIVGRRGVFLIRGKGIQLLHRRIEPLLDGRFTGERLVRAAGDKREVVREYLDGLIRAGAISDGASVSPIAAGFPRAVAGTQTLRTGQLSVVVCLDRLLEPRPSTLLVHVGTAAEVTRSLLNRRRIAAGATEIVIDRGETSGADLLKRGAMFVRHLLAIALSHGSREEGLSIYKAGPGVTLRRCAMVRSGDRTQPGVWRQMRIARLADVPQVPLVVFAGELPGCDRCDLGVGLSAKEVESEVLLHVVARAYLSIAASRQECLPANLIPTLESRERRRVNITLTHAGSSPAAIGLTRSDCMESLLCSQVIERLDGRSGRHCDLTRVVSSSPRVTMLQRLLRLRRDALCGYLDDRWYPVVVFRGPGMVVARLGHEEAISEALVRAIAAEYYRWMGITVVAVPALQSSSTRWRRLHRALQCLPRSDSMAIGRINSHGFRFYVGWRFSDAEARRLRHSC